MSTISKRSVRFQTNICISSGCNLSSEVVCRHCHEQYCHLCFMCHRKNLINDMQSISNQMLLNRRDGITEVLSFINKQSNDAHEQAKKLLDDAIERIIKASQNIHTYIENRRRAKLNRLKECLIKFDKDAQLVNSKLSQQDFLSADTILELRRKYAYNMFDETSSNLIVKNPVKNEKFFENYRYYDELINLREKWTFLQPALTTVYFPAKKDISLDTILTFLEYRHDRVLENYRDYLANNEQSKELSLKPTEDLLHELSFVSKKELLKEDSNFSYINETTIKNDSGQGDDEISSDSNHSWQIEDYEKINHKLDQLMKILDQRNQTLLQ